MNIAVCQPSRQSIMTGRYPHRNGAEGFEPIDEDVPTLQESLRAGEYLNGILGMDGRSFLPLLHGETQADREYVFTEFHKTFARRCFPMRCVHSKRFGYLVNFWAGRTDAMRMDSTSGLSFKAMQEAAETDPEIAARVTLFEHRVLEEFYDFENDPDALHNLIADPRYRDQIEQMRGVLEDRMKRTADPALQAFRERANPAKLDEFIKQQRIRARGE